MALAKRPQFSGDTPKGGKLIRKLFAIVTEQDASEAMEEREAARSQREAEHKRQARPKPMEKISNPPPEQTGESRDVETIAAEVAGILRRRRKIERRGPDELMRFDREVVLALPPADLEKAMTLYGATRSGHGDYLQGVIAVHIGELFAADQGAGARLWTALMAAYPEQHGRRYVAYCSLAEAVEDGAVSQDHAASLLATYPIAERQLHEPRIAFDEKARLGRDEMSP